MKKKLFVLLMSVVTTISLAACGGNSNSSSGIDEVKTDTKIDATEASQQIVVEGVSGESSNESIEDVVVESAEEQTPASVEESEVADIELPHWEGVKDYYGHNLKSGGWVGVDICFPSSLPKTPGDFKIQADPALIMVTGPGYADDGSDIKVETLADAFEVTKPKIVSDMDRIRNIRYSDFDFVVESGEELIINDLPMYKYTGKHTYNMDGSYFELPFVAYSFDTKQVEGVYLTLIVIDDSINWVGIKQPLEEGVLEAYALKMAESIVVKKSLF